MRIQVLYITDCPHHPTAVKRLKEVLSAEGVSAEIDEREVTDAMMAREWKFGGSPTIRVNGRDVFGEPESFGLSCRIHPGVEEPGVPPVEAIRRAIQAARMEEKA